MHLAFEQYLPDPITEGNLTRCPHDCHDNTSWQACHRAWSSAMLLSMASLATDGTLTVFVHVLVHVHTHVFYGTPEVPYTIHVHVHTCISSQCMHSPHTFHIGFESVPVRLQCCCISYNLLGHVVHLQNCAHPCDHADSSTSQLYTPVLTAITQCKLFRC